MSQQVSPQADIGALSWRSLGAFSSILATLSADDVAPAAMLQMEKLGTFFPVNGPKAARVPDLLQRCKSVRLDRMSLAIGWRKDDSASLMSESAGGQAVSLLCNCIFSLFDQEDASTILTYLSIRLLPPGAHCASMLQLHRVGEILSKKLDTLAFGSFLAAQVVRICEVYKQMGTQSPEGLLDRMSLDAAVDIFVAISRAVRESGVLVRIVGTSSMGYIVAIVLSMFPEDCLITVEGVVINSGTRQLVFIELGRPSDQQGPAQIFVEEILEKMHTVVLPIQSSRIPVGSHENLASVGRFRWPGHLANLLHLYFTNVGLPRCPHDILVASSDLLYSLPCWTEKTLFMTKEEEIDEKTLPDGCLGALLGVTPFHRMQRVWKEVLGASPNLPRKDLRCAWSEFTRILWAATSSVPCICKKCGPDMWLEDPASVRFSLRCPMNKVWSDTARVLQSAMAAVFINPGENVTVSAFHSYYNLFDIKDMLRCVLCNRPQKPMFSASILRMFMASSYTLAKVRSSCVLYPTELETLQKSADFSVSFELIDGMLVFNGRYFHTLDTREEERPRAKNSMIYKPDRIIPSRLGEHSRLTLTIREKLHSLELGAMIHGQESVARINLRNILEASIALTRSKTCEHSTEDTLHPEYASKVMITSVFAPRATDKIPAIAQVKSNATAQLLCCELGVKCILVSDCCLTCALEEVGAGNEEVILITS